MFTVSGLHAHYGKSHVLHGVDFDVDRGEVVALLGRNGSGRSTLLKAIMGMVPPSSGSVRLDGVELAGLRPYRICRRGLSYVPEERLVFTQLTVEENFRIGIKPAHPGGVSWTADQMYEFFPRLHERRSTLAGKLSGGEQQMLTICRSLLGNPRILFIDEPTEGLAPMIVDVVMDVIRRIGESGVSVVLVEQKLTFALSVARRVLVMGHGNIVFSGQTQAFGSNREVQERWLGVS